MRFRQLDIPSRLVASHRQGDLVLFVGAGASMDPPSSLPSFVQLAKLVGQDFGRSLSPSERKAPDLFLGRCVDDQLPVHERVRDLLSAETSRPNDTHKAIAALSAAGPTVRVVTTNYDRHVSAALKGRDLTFDEYRAPALPMGNDFEGVVHLHGALDQPPERLVVTDKDFGRAYLGDMWAARFLERMYSRFDVLFIGYGHNDVVMRYLGRGLSAGRWRYVMTHQPQDRKWRELDIDPIDYGLMGGLHSELPEGLTSWARHASSGLLDHRQRIQTLVDAAPPEIPEDHDYLVALLDEPTTARLIAGHLDGEEWVTWLERVKMTDVLNSDAVLDEADAVWASWFASQLDDEVRAQRALDMLNRSGGRLRRPLWGYVAHAVARHRERPPWIEPWLPKLVRLEDPPDPHFLNYMLADSRWPDDSSTMQLLLEELLEPRPATTRYHPDDIEFLGEYHWLDSTRQATLSPQMGTLAPWLLTMAEGHLTRAYLLSSVTHPRTDRLSFLRVTIAHLDEDYRETAADVLIELARDALQHLLDQGGALGTGHVDKWSASSVPLLRRIAIHCVAHTDHLTADAKLGGSTIVTTLRLPMHGARSAIS